MDEHSERHRVTWTTRINVRPTSRDLIRLLAHDEHLSVATAIGMAIEAYVTARSTA
jgi:hypothetical protein